jgi:anti-sigma-K factor RskA
MRRLLGCVRSANAPREAHKLRVLAPLLECLPPAPPPPGLLARIEQRISTEHRVLERGLLRARLIGAAVAGAMAGAVGVLTLTPHPDIGRSGTPMPLAVIEGAERVAMLEARTLDGGHYLRLDHFGLRAPLNGTLELWLVRQGTDRPASLGLISAPSSVTVLPLAHDISDGDVLAVSEEPAGGAPGVGPSGSVIVVARVGAGE